MPYTYRNKNTHQEVEYSERNARLGHLQNWELVEEPEPGTSAAVPAQRAPADGPEAPARNASKDAWIEYAVSRGAERSDVEDMKRDELADEFGPKE